MLPISFIAAVFVSLVAVCILPGAISQESTTTLNASICKVAGFKRNPFDCSKFYRCVDYWGNGKRFSIFEFNCPSSTIFDEIHSVCTYPAQAHPKCIHSSSEESSPTTTSTVPTPSIETTTVFSSTSVVMTDATLLATGTQPTTPQTTTEFSESILISENLSESSGTLETTSSSETPPQTTESFVTITEMSPDEFATDSDLISESITNTSTVTISEPGVTTEASEITETFEAISEISPDELTTEIPESIAATETNLESEITTDEFSESTTTGSTQPIPSSEPPLTAVAENPIESSVTTLSPEHQAFLTFLNSELLNFLNQQLQNYLKPNPSLSLTLPATSPSSETTTINEKIFWPTYYRGITVFD